LEGLVTSLWDIKNEIVSTMASPVQSRSDQWSDQ